MSILAPPGIQPRIVRGRGAPTNWYYLAGGGRADPSGASGFRDVFDLVVGVAGRRQSLAGPPGATYIDGPYGKCLDLTGAGWCDVTTPPMNSSAAWTITATARTKPTVAGGVLYNLGSDVTGFGLGVGGGTWDDTANNIVVFIANVAWFAAPSAPIGSGWFTASVTFDRATLQTIIYLNGRLVRSGAIPGMPADLRPGERAGIGGYYNGRPFGGLPYEAFTGQVADVKFYNYAQTPGQVARDHADPFWRLRPPLAGGTTVEWLSGAGVLPDIGGVSYNGPQYWGPRYFGTGYYLTGPAPIITPTTGVYNGPEYWGVPYFGTGYFLTGPAPIIPPSDFLIGGWFTTEAEQSAVNPWGVDPEETILYDPGPGPVSRPAPRPAPTAITVLGADCSSIPGPPVTDPLDSTGADLIVLMTVNAGFLPDIDIVDTYSNIWTLWDEQLSFDTLPTKLWYCSRPVTGPGHTFATTQPISAIGVILAAGSDNEPEGNCVGASSSGTDDVTSIRPGVVHPAFDGALLVACLANISDRAQAIDSGYTILTARGDGSTAFAIAWLAQGSAAPENPTFSWTTPEQAGAMGAAFYPAGATPAPLEAGDWFTTVAEQSAQDPWGVDPESSTLLN
jgi:hypothetical protein